MISARAISGDSLYHRQDERLPDRPRYAVAGVEKFVPPDWEFGGAGLERVPLEEWDGILTGDGPGPASIASVRKTIAALRFEPILL